jgi:hypothetical protein
MIPKSGNRFSEKIMPSDSKGEMAAIFAVKGGQKAEL